MFVWLSRKSWEAGATTSQLLGTSSRRRAGFHLLQYPALSVLPTHSLSPYSALCLKIPDYTDLVPRLSAPINDKPCILSYGAMVCLNRWSTDSYRVIVSLILFIRVRRPLVHTSIIVRAFRVCRAVWLDRAPWQLCLISSIHVTQQSNLIGCAE